MAKRAPADEREYNPIDQALVHAATGPVATEEPPAPVARQQTVVPAAAPVSPSPVTTTAPAARPEPVAPSPSPSNVVQMPVSHVAGPQPGEGRSRVSQADPNERFQDRRIPLSPAEDAELERLVTAFAMEMGAKVKGTHIGRALFGIFTDAYDHVLGRAKRATRMKRPGNGDPIGLMKFEQHVRDTIEAGLRDYLTRGRHEHR